MKQTMQHTRHRLATLLLLVVVMLIPQVANAVIEKPSKGDGTKESPYLIENYNNFHWFCYEVNYNGNGGICAKLMNNITLQSTSEDEVIGNHYNHPFWGEFDGNNKTISGVNRPWDLGYGPSPNCYYYAGGLFGCIKAPSGTTAVVKNLTVTGEVNISVEDRVYYIGGVIGIAYGDVNLSNIISKVNVTITNDASDAHCGGVVGSVEWFGNGNYSGNLTVSNCVNYGTINVACGEICGGVVGYIRDGSITDCLNVGNITNSEDGYTAGILGYVNSKGCSLSRCLNLGTVTNTKKAANAYAVYYKKDNIGSTSDLYYKSGVGGTALKATEVSDEQLKSGSLAYTLGTGSWGQSLGNNSVNDAYPRPNKTAYKVNFSDIGYYNSITSTIPTGDFTTTIETSSQYHSNQIRIGDTRSFTVKPTAKTGRYIEKVTHNGNRLSTQSVDGNVKTYSYTVALNNNFEITVTDFSCSNTLNQSTMDTAINLADNTLGSTETFTATPKLGYYITGATINGETINGTVVSGKTDGTKSFSFTVKESNTVVINTAAISCTKTLNQSTTTLNLADNYVGSTETFTVTPKAGNYVTNVIINGETVAGTAISGKTDGTKSYSFMVKESNTLTVNTEAIVCTTTLGESTSTLNINDNYVGSTETFTATPNAGYYITGATINGETVAGTTVSGKTDGTKSFSFTVKECNAVTIKTAAIAYTKLTGDGFTTNLQDNLNDKQIGSTMEFTITPTAGNYITTVLFNDNELAPSATDANGTKHYSFIVSESNAIVVNTAAIAYTKPTGSGFTTNLPDVLQFGSTVEFTVTPKEGKGILEVSHNYNSLSPSASDTDGTIHYAFTVTEQNIIIVAMTPDKVGDAYEITNAAQLYWFAEHVNNGNTTINGKLTADIVVNENVLDANGNLYGDGVGFRVWTPIGKDEGGKRYEGTFDGQGHTISGLYINDVGKSFVGLFCATGTNSVIKNVGITDSYFRSYQHAAGICVSNGGVIDNCYSAATCAVSDEGVGGIVSWNGGTISNCHNVGEITGDYHGAICSNNMNGTTTNCYYLKGTADEGIHYGSGEVTGKTAEQFASGEVAWLLNGSEAGENPAWRQTLGEDEYPVMDNTHGIVHYGYNACTPFYSNDAVSQTQPEHHYGADDFCTNCGSGHPATLDSDGYYEIADAGQLYWFAQQVNSGENTINAVLTANIVVNTGVLKSDGSLSDNNSIFRVWTPIGNFDNSYKGTFDGQGHTISGLYVNEAGKHYVGLFAYINSGAKIMNVGVTDSYFFGNYSVGGVCGQAENVSLSNCYNTGTVKGVQNVGGVCGYSFGSSISYCYNIGAVSGYCDGGGVCGYFGNGYLTNCYYLNTSCEQGIGYVSGKATAKTADADQFKSGEVAWLLNGSEAGESPAWRQTIGEDEHPVLDAAKGIVIYSTQTGLNPIVRPTAGTLVGAADVYNFAGIDGKKVYGIEHTGTLAAEHPYVFTTKKYYVSFVPSEENVTDDTPTCGLTGVLEPAGKRVYGQNNTEGEDVSIVFTADALNYANPEGDMVKYGKCYINADECFITSESVSAMAKSIAYFGNGGTTSIDEIDATAGGSESKEYNLQGVEVGKDYKGIVIVNGKKMVRK